MNFNEISEEYFAEAILIRKVEERLISLFKEGKVNGTVHTCIGQEFSALSFCKQLKTGDFVFSNHRCHGHYIALFGDYKGLISEVTGKKDGVCGGVGGSQHLCKGDIFFTNGIQGGIVPVAAGMGLSLKLRREENIGIVFIGDGTLGQGVVYETLNIVSKWRIPLLIVLENNLYAQSTHQSTTLAGNILDRPKAFGIKTFESSTHEVENIFRNAKESLEYVRRERLPAFHLVNTYRLSPHSTSDDLRSPEEIEEFAIKDPINVFRRENSFKYNEIEASVNAKIKKAVEETEKTSELSIDEYVRDANSFDDQSPLKWTDIELGKTSDRLVTQLNMAFRELLDTTDDVVFIGEDIHSPYGGAFKCKKDLSFHYPERVITTPISEAAITGIANGLAMRGFRPFLEIMFGDFITLSFDQIVNHASKFFDMYNKQITCPIVIRTPMGGRRGFGPTHSQTLDKFLLGIDNVKIIAINYLVDVCSIYREIYRSERHPVIVIENKGDYGRKVFYVKGDIFENFTFQSSNTRYPLLKIAPKITEADVTIISYGGCLSVVLESCEKLFVEKEILAEVIILTQICPLPMKALQDAISTECVYIVEECSSFAGLGSEIISSLFEEGQSMRKAKRITSLPIPIPASKKLEQNVLVSADKIASVIEDSFYE